MKKCDHVKGMILADYTDGELEKDISADVESHLLDCSECRAFLKEVKHNAVMPVRQALHQTVPAELWDKIRQSMEDEHSDAGISVPMFFFPRMVPLFASLMLVFLAGSVTFNTMHVQQAKDRDQGEYLVSLLGPPGAVSLADNNEGATPIEHYFL